MENNSDNLKKLKQLFIPYGLQSQQTLLKPLIKNQKGGSPQFIFKFNNKIIKNNNMDITLQQPKINQNNDFDEIPLIEEPSVLNSFMIRI